MKQSLELKKIGCRFEEEVFYLEADFLLPFFGLKMELGQIAFWGLNLYPYFNL